MDFVEIGGRLAVFYVPFLFALCFHEFAHGLVAKWRGDNTAERMGRLTLNPTAHADMVGTVALPILAIAFQTQLFLGWAKPVPVDSRNLKKPRSDMFWIAIAGPGSNILLAIIAVFVLAILQRYSFLSQYGSTETFFVEGLYTFIRINLFLAVFNMIPLHPLDGGKVLARFLPPSINYKLEQNEQITSMILLGLVLVGALHILVYPVGFMMNALIALANFVVF